MIPYNEDTPDNLPNFLQNIIDKKIVTTKISEPVPKVNDGPVHISVGTTAAVVIHKQLDVFIFIYSSAIADNLKKLDIFTEVAALTKKHNPYISNQLLFSKIDIDKNSLPQTLKSFGKTYPTAVLFPLQNKSNPIVYKNEFKMINILYFLTVNCGDYFSLPASAAHNLKDEL